MSRVAVVGAGILGLSTAYSLMRDGVEFDLFEPSAPGGGRSIGESRIFRHDHGDPRLVDLSIQSRSLWEEWAEEFGFRLVSSGGSIVLGQEALDRLGAMESASGLKIREVEPAELRQLLPVLAPYTGPAAADMRGGAIQARLAIALLLDRVGEFLVPEPVESLSNTPSGAAEIRTPAGAREYSAALVCAGVKTGDLARSAGTEIPVETEAQLRTTFRLRTSSGARSRACFQDSSREFGKADAYGSPVGSSEFYAVEVAETTPLPDLGSSGSKGPVDPGSGGHRLKELADRASRYVRRALPGLDPQPVGQVPSWTTKLPWGDDAIAVWQSGSLFFMVGHDLFKQAPVLGRALGEAVTGGGLADYLRPEARLGDPAG